MSYAKIRPRRGTKTEWQEFNPILMEGELGIEYPDTGIGTGLCKFKLGDGFTKWSELVYAFSAENATSIDGGTVSVWNNVQFRRGTTDEWELADPVLEAGEPVFDITKGAIKIGDGEHSFNALDYLGYSWEMDNEYDFGDMNEGEIVPGPDDKDYDFGDMGGWGSDWSTDSEVPNEESEPEVPVLMSPTPPIYTPPVEEPTEEEPVVEDPVVDEPVVETPIEETPVEEEPIVETPVEDEPIIETPIEEDPVEEPIVEDPVDETPIDDTPVEEPTEEVISEDEETPSEEEIETPVEEEHTEEPSSEEDE